MSCIHVDIEILTRDHIECTGLVRHTDIVVGTDVSGNTMSVDAGLVCEIGRVAYEYLLCRDKDALLVVDNGYLLVES